jgi:hypothetical protein
MLGNRHEAGLRKLPDDVRQPRQVEPTVHRREKRHAEPTEQREGQPVDVGVDHIEVARPFRNRFQQQGAGGIRVCTLSPEA